MIEIERTIRSIASRKPFRPFVVELASGASIRVDHPEAIVVRGPRAVFIDHDHGVSIFDAGDVVRIQAAGNGASRRH
jgi:hypothetical protein